jgi:hypothetical protein
MTKLQYCALSALQKPDKFPSVKSAFIYIIKKELPVFGNSFLAKKLDKLNAAII